jgi:hypothetical protein
MANRACSEPRPGAVIWITVAAGMVQMSVRVQQIVGSSHFNPSVRNAGLIAAEGKSAAPVSIKASQARSSQLLLRSSRRSYGDSLGPHFDAPEHAPWHRWVTVSMNRFTGRARIRKIRRVLTGRFLHH